MTDPTQRFQPSQPSQKATEEFSRFDAAASALFNTPVEEVRELDVQYKEDRAKAKPEEALELEEGDESPSTP